MTDSGLIISWDGQQRTFPSGQTITVGRAPEADIVIDDPRVSREHAHLRYEGGVWEFQDLGSTRGSFVGGERVERHQVADRVTIQLGDGTAGPALDLLPPSTPAAPPPPAVGDALAGSPPPPMGAPLTGGPPPDREPVPDHTPTVITGGQRPGGALREPDAPGATVVTGNSITIECAGHTQSFDPGTKVVLGRDPSSDIVTANPTTGRRHAVVQHDGTTWVIEDQGSANGTWIDGERITREALTGNTAVWLGDPEAGERVVLVASGWTRPTSPKARRSKPTGITVLAGIVLLAAIGVILWLLINPLGGVDVDRLARGTVQLQAGRLGGSGTIIDASEGLILTNAHVVAPDAPGLAVRYRDTAEEQAELISTDRDILVFVAAGRDEVAEPRFIAELVTVDGYLDLAVIRIVRTVGGALVQPRDLSALTEIPIGDSDSIRSGDDIHVVGYPALGASLAPTITRGIVSGIVQDVRVGSDRAWINVDAEISGGNSGGLAADERGRLVGVPTLGRESGAARINSLAPINMAGDLIAAARGDEEYDSPYVRALAGTEDVTTFGFTTPSGSGVSAGCGGGQIAVAAGDQAVAVTFDYEGFEAGQHQDLLVRIELADGRPIAAAATDDVHPFRFDAAGCATATMGFGQGLPSGTYLVAFYVGPQYELIGRGELVVP